MHAHADQRAFDFVAVQPLALVDHVCTVDKAQVGLLICNGGTCARGTALSEVGGSKRVALDEIQRLLGAHTGLNAGLHTCLTSCELCMTGSACVGWAQRLFTAALCIREPLPQSRSL